MAATESATSRLGRLLTMVPWLVNRQGIDIEQAAAELGVTRAQIESDLALLFVCGTPGHLPDDLIEAEWEGGRVFLRNADEIAAPLRLGLDEALALIVGLRTLAAIPGLDERAAVDRALAKLEAATGGVAEGSSRVTVAVEHDADQTLQTVRGALDAHRRLHLRYLVASRDEATERDVDPMRVLLMDGRWYLEGWCHRADDVRLFRLDRIERVDVLDVDGTPPASARVRDLSADIFVPSPSDQAVTLRLAPEAAWVADYYPVESMESVEPVEPGAETGQEAGRDGSLLVTVRTGDVAWVRQLVWRLGGSARITAPASVRESVARGAREALAAYDPAVVLSAPGAGG